MCCKNSGCSAKEQAELEKSKNNGDFAYVIKHLLAAIILVAVGLGITYFIKYIFN